MVSIEWSPQSESDLADIWRHIAADNETAADHWLWRVEMQAEKLSRYPMIGRAREEIGKGLRSVPEYPYLILYRFNGERVEIVRVVHGARDLEDIM